MEFRPHSKTPFQVDLARKRIYIHAPPAKNMDSMMSVEYRPIGPGLQAVPLPWKKRLLQGAGGEALQLGKFDRTKRGVGVERL